MIDEELKKITDTNFRVITMLGYAMALLEPLETFMSNQQSEKYKSWRKSVDNVIYFDKPMELL